VLISCAVREGWGLTITEAARLGTPSVAYDVPGLRDSILPGRTGTLTDQKPNELAAEIRRLLDDPDRYQAVRVAAWKEWRSLEWSRTAESFERAVGAAAERQAS
jgi:glycosyltransferase involved in cell wall biosynthesis